jgi:ABC-type sugar transport system substrate-binding protein
LSAFIEIEADMDATVAQNPYAIGKVGVKQATRAANGKSQDKVGATRLPARVKE